MKNHGKTFCIILCVVFVAVICSDLKRLYAGQQNNGGVGISAPEIMSRNHRASKLDGSEEITTLTIFNAKGDKRVRKMAIVSKLYNGGATEKRLIRFIEPPDVKGTGLLTYDYEREDDDIWFYMPALRKTRRIVSSEKAKSFMGSEFSYADLTPPPVEDFNHRFIKTQVIDNTECWVIESVPKTEDIAEENGFSKRIAYIGKRDYTVRKAIYYDLDGELQKELITKQIKELDSIKHRYRPMYMRMVNKQNGRRSEARVNAIKLRRDVADQYFTLRYLERD